MAWPSLPGGTKKKDEDKKVKMKKPWCLGVLVVKKVGNHK
jgi:hypothetical protein